MSGLHPSHLDLLQSDISIKERDLKQTAQNICKFENKFSVNFHVLPTKDPENSLII